jgi:hypothetical protein
MNKAKIALLFGAGISLAVEKPSTQQITDEILSENGLIATKRRLMETDGKGARNKITHVPFDREILDFLMVLNKIAEEHSPVKQNVHPSRPLNERLKHIPNYEDLFFMLVQIYHALSEDFNPYGKLLIKSTKFEQLMQKWKLNDNFEPNKRDFIGYSTAYINNTVIRKLNEKMLNTDNLNLIRDILKHKKPEKVDIFTLNHDTVLEQLLTNENITPLDGFGEKDGDLKKWTPQLFDRPITGKTRLLKLHGSIDWKTFKIEGHESNVPVLAKYAGEHDIENEIVEIADSHGTKYIHPSNPHILIGTDNKIGEYLHLHYWDLHYRFRQLLRKKDRLIVSGYSFGDSEINGQILEWLLNEENKKLIVIDIKDKLSFFQESGYALRIRRQQLLDNKKLIYLDKGIQETTLSDIEKALYDS